MNLNPFFFFSAGYLDDGWVMVFVLSGRAFDIQEKVNLVIYFY